ncbi:MAG: hypothetical protein ACI39E_03025 [Acutalibacteraceae bacterium]
MSSKNKRFADDGWAIWIDGDDTSTVYINDWLSPKKKSYVDMAIHIRNVKTIRRINIYVPFALEANEIEDISLRLYDEKILRAIFGSVCLIDYRKNDCTSELAYNGRTVDLLHLSGTPFTVEPLADGSLLTLLTQELQEQIANDEIYLLFRIPHKSLDEIFKPRVNVGNALERLRDLITTPVVFEKYGYSIRINEARLLPAEINRIGAFHRQKLKKAVITVSLDESYEVNDRNCYRIRRLEEDLYKHYVPDGFRCSDVITYQWNQSRDANLQGHFNFYFDITRSTVSKTSMLLYMILLMIVGIAGGALWDWIKYLLVLGI